MKPGSRILPVLALLALLTFTALAHLSFAANTSKGPKPAPSAGNASAAAGEKLFVTYCQTCHGKNGHGDGPAAAGLTPKPRDFSSPKNFKSKTDDQVFLLISKGGAAQKLSPAMPAWGNVLKKEQIWQLIAYIRGFPARDSVARGKATK